MTKIADEFDAIRQRRDEIKREEERDKRKREDGIPGQSETGRWIQEYESSIGLRQAWRGKRGERVSLNPT